MIHTDFSTGVLTGPDVVRAERTVDDLLPYWHNQEAAEHQKLQPLYTTCSMPAVEQEGVLLWGSTVLRAGNVGGEYFMTRGHFHVKPTHGELIIVQSGTGILLLMDRQRNCQHVNLEPGLTYWIDGNFAHRTINTGNEDLIFWCAWPSDCGHEYAEIEANGFSERLFAP